MVNRIYFGTDDRAAGEQMGAAADLPLMYSLSVLAHQGLAQFLHQKLQIFPVTGPTVAAMAFCVASTPQPFMKINAHD